MAPALPQWLRALPMLTHLDLFFQLKNMNLDRGVEGARPLDHITIEHLRLTDAVP